MVLITHNSLPNRIKRNKYNSMSGVSNIWQNNFYSKFRPIPKWAYKLTCDAIDDLLYEGSIDESYKDVLGDAIVSVNVGKREVSVINTYFAGVQANFPGRVSNTGELSITFNENSNMIVSRILEKIFRASSHDFRYFRDGAPLGYSEAGKRVSLSSPLEITIFKPNVGGIEDVGDSNGDVDNYSGADWIAKYSFYNVFLISIQEEQLDYMAEDEILTRTARFSFDYMLSKYKDEKLTYAEPPAEEEMEPASMAETSAEGENANTPSDANPGTDNSEAADGNAAGAETPSDASTDVTASSENGEQTAASDASTEEAAGETGGETADAPSDAAAAENGEAAAEAAAGEAAAGENVETAKESTDEQTEYNLVDEDGIEHTYTLNKESLERITAELKEQGFEGEELVEALHELTFEYMDEVVSENTETENATPNDVVETATPNDGIEPIGKTPEQAVDDTLATVKGLKATYGHTDFFTIDENGTVEFKNLGAEAHNLDCSAVGAMYMGQLDKNVAQIIKDKRTNCDRLQQYLSSDAGQEEWEEVTVTNASDIKKGDVMIRAGAQFGGSSKDKNNVSGSNHIMIAAADGVDGQKIQMLESTGDKAGIQGENTRTLNYITKGTAKGGYKVYRKKQKLEAPAQTTADLLTN